ncbi:MAG: thrombospondin type 3 repeat-containing protein, partial [Myxococcota bacterium]
DACDLCPEIPSYDRLDFDGDGVGDVCDNCPAVSNRDQQDADGDGIGDVCDDSPLLRGGGSRCQSVPLGSWVAPLLLVPLALRRRRLR